MGDMFSFEQESATVPSPRRSNTEYSGKVRLLGLLLAIAVIVFLVVPSLKCHHHKHGVEMVDPSDLHSSRHHFSSHHGLNNLPPHEKYTRIEGEKAPVQRDKETDDFVDVPVVYDAPDDGNEGDKEDADHDW